MSGCPIVPVRFPEMLMAMMDKAIKSANKTRRLAPYNRSTWIKDCVLDRLNKLERGAKPKRKKGKPEDEVTAA